MSRSSHYEISAREREDEQRRHYDEFDAPEETYWDYLRRVTSSERPKAGGHDGCTTSASSTPGTGRSDTKEAA